jgi:serine/threonine protein kinase
MQQERLIGDKLGPYRIQAKLGEGGMAWVYKAYDENLAREVALKVIHPDKAAEAEFIARFRREAQMIARLQHRHIVTVYTANVERNITYLAMQFVRGGSLRERLGYGPVDPRVAALYILQMARALHHAHLNGIVHRDVKPANMLLADFGKNELLLSDFGIARSFDSQPLSMMNQPFSIEEISTFAYTGSGTLTGTPQYMAPEQWLNRPIDGRTDVYALGVVLFEMLTGHHPFHAEHALALGLYHVRTNPAPPRALNPAIPESLERITLRALAKDPNQRFQSAEEMAQALKDIFEPVTISGGGINRSGTEPVRENRPINWRRVFRLRNIALVLLIILIVLQILSRLGVVNFGIH